MATSLELINALERQRRGIEAQPPPISQIDLLERQAELQEDAEERQLAMRQDDIERNRLLNANQLNDMRRRRIQNVQALMGGASNSDAFLEMRRPDVVAMDGSRGTGTFESRDLPEQVVDPRLEEQGRALQIRRQQGELGDDGELQHQRRMEQISARQGALTKRQKGSAKARSDLQVARTKAKEGAATTKAKRRQSELKGRVAEKRRAAKIAREAKKASRLEQNINRYIQKQRTIMAQSQAKNPDDSDLWYIWNPQEDIDFMKMKQRYNKFRSSIAPTE